VRKYSNASGRYNKEAKSWTPFLHL
jgi:hypothetical protein